MAADVVVSILEEHLARARRDARGTRLSIADLNRELRRLQDGRDDADQRIVELERAINQQIADQAEAHDCGCPRYLPTGVWAGLADRTLSIPLGSEVFAGVDVGWSHDSAAVVLAHRLADGRIVLRAKVWGREMRPGLVEDFLRQIKLTHSLRAVAYDPRFFGRSMEILARDGIVGGIVGVEMLGASVRRGDSPSYGWQLFYQAAMDASGDAAAVEETEQGWKVSKLRKGDSPSAYGWQLFYQAAMDGRIVHNGDAVLAAHVEAATVEETEQGWKVTKLRSTSRIDALAAAVMAHTCCVASA